MSGTKVEDDVHQRSAQNNIFDSSFCHPTKLGFGNHQTTHPLMSAMIPLTYRVWVRAKIVANGRGI